MPFEFVIEVCAEPDASTTEKGNVLEAFVGSFLHTQNFQVQSNIRVTGLEIDLLAVEKTTGEQIIVECKAYRSNISADVITKLLGNVDVRDAQAGWLMTTHALGKDAKGIESEWENRPPERRRRLRIYSPDKLIDRLARAGVIKPAPRPERVAAQFKLGGEAYLLLTRQGEFWALPLVDLKSGIPAALVVYDAKTGVTLSAPETLAWLSQLDSSLSALDWIPAGSESPSGAALQDELEHIVAVPVAEHWADYRPSRPSDFVGRETIQRDVFSFFDRVRAGETRTRLIALKAPSGWGKSSSVLKIADKARNKRNKGRYFVHTVDSRAALTSRFPELAVVSAIKAAIKADFITPVNSVQFGNSGNVLNTAGTKEFLDLLVAQERIIVVFFDQFEELLYKDELADVFNEMRVICNAIEAAQANIVIGFSWKTDGTITTEHGAYHLWHGLADRRFEIDLPPFSDKEVALAINRFGTEMGEPVLPQLRRLLQDHCQGFPWLLKKLCIHILELARSGSDQSDVLSRNLNIVDLFKRDLEELNAAESSCIRQVAFDAPAEFFKVSQNFGEETVTGLINKRLITRSGTRLSIYWDIFRDYILNGKIPYIPITYIPQAHLQSYVRATKYLVAKDKVTYQELGTAMGLSSGATDNLVRDLVNLGHVDAIRRYSIVKPLFVTPEEAFSTALGFWGSHEIIKLLSTEVSPGRRFTEAAYNRIFHGMLDRSEFSLKTLEVYAKRTLEWLLNMGLVERVGDELAIQDHNTASGKTFNQIERSSARTRKYFLGNTSPANCVKFYDTVGSSGIPVDTAEQTGGRNTISALVALGLLRIVDGMVKRATEPAGSSSETIQSAARGSSTVQLVYKALQVNPNLQGREVGEALASQLDTPWGEASRLRYGTALATWTKWAHAMPGRRRRFCGPELPL